MAGGGGADDLEDGAQFGDVGMADGVAVHGGIVEGRLGEAGGEVCGEHAALGVPQAHRLRPHCRLRGGQQAVEGVRDGQEGHQASPRL